MKGKIPVDTHIPSPREIAAFILRAKFPDGYTQTVYNLVLASAEESHNIMMRIYRSKSAETDQTTSSEDFNLEPDAIFYKCNNCSKYAARDNFCSHCGTPINWIP